MWAFSFPSPFLRRRSQFPASLSVLIPCTSTLPATLGSALSQAFFLLRVASPLLSDRRARFTTIACYGCAAERGSRTTCAVDSGATPTFRASSENRDVSNVSVNPVEAGDRDGDDGASVSAAPGWRSSDVRRFCPRPTLQALIVFACGRLPN